MIALPAWLLAGTPFPLKIVKDYPWQVGCAALAIACVWQHSRIVDWRERAAAEVTSHKKTKAGYIEAQAEAAQLAEAARIKMEQRYAELAKEADNANDEADSWRARAQRYANSGGVRVESRACPSGATGDTGTGTETDLAASGDGPGTVTLSRSDFDTLTANTARLLTVHAWGEALVADGLASDLAEIRNSDP